MLNFNIESQSRIATISSTLALAVFLSTACQPFAGSDAEANGEEIFAVLGALGGKAGAGLGLGNLSSGTTEESQYYCALTDADVTSYNQAGWKTVRVVSPSTDIGGRYKSFADLSYAHRHGIAIIQPTYEPPFAEREYITFFSAGHQGPEFSILNWFWEGFPASMTGQKRDWAFSWSNVSSNSLNMSTCKASLRYRMIVDAQANGRLPANRTYHTGAFDSHFSWADFNAMDKATAWVDHIKSLGNPRRIKGVYLAGSSMGGCLANYIGSQLNKDPEWGKVPVIVQGGDPVCPNGANSNAPAFLTIGPSKIYNPKADNASIWLDKNKYKTYANNSGGFFRDEFPNKERIKIYNILGGGKVTDINRARSFSITDEGNSGKDATLSYANGAFGGQFTSNEWYRQFFMYECHACLGRNWHHWIMGHGDATQHGMMRFYRDSYNDLNFWGAWVNFWTGDYDAASDTYSGGLRHETPLLQTRKVQLYADKDQSDFLLREIVVPINIMAHTTATYGVDFDFLDENKDPVPVYPSAFPGGAPDESGFPASAKNAFLKPNGAGTPTLYVRKPKTAGGQNRGYFYIRILNDYEVESDEQIVLRIGNYPVLGRPRKNARKYKLMIRDHDTVPHTQQTCEAVGGVWNPSGKPRCTIYATISHDFASEFLPSTGGTTVGTCAANGETWRADSEMCAFQAEDRNTCSTARAAGNEANCETEQRQANSRTSVSTSRSTSASTSRRNAN